MKFLPGLQADGRRQRQRDEHVEPIGSSYVSSEALHAARDEGRELRGPAPASPDRGKVFTIEAFDVHVEERFALCPAQHRSGKSKTFPH